MSQSAPNTLQAALGHTFREQQLLVKALTHSSLAYEQTLEGRQAEGAILRAKKTMSNWSFWETRFWAWSSQRSSSVVFPIFMKESGPASAPAW